MDRRRLRFDVAKAERALRFANELSDALHELKITHKALAQELGVTFHTINSWTRGVDPSVPGGENLDKLCALLEGRTEGLGVKIARVVGHTWQPVVGVGAETVTTETEEDLSAIAARAGVPHKLTNLPLSLSNYVGKEKEVDQVTALVRAHRLVTLTGMGGIGKTRLSLEVARGLLAGGSYAAGVWLVELAPLRDPEYVPQAISQVLDVPERAGVSPLQSLQEYLQHRSLLLVLDNCEHLVDACADVASHLLRTCADVSILASSREALGIRGECSWQVATLSMPAPLPTNERRSPDDLMEYEAVLLFLDRARSVSPGFGLTEDNVAAVEQICRRLDGVPLAIELATALLPYLSPAQIARGLNNRFDLLTGGSRDVLPRHKTLYAAVEWSYSLLTEAEKALFRRMSVFAGDCGLEAVESVCVGEEVGGEAALPLLRRLVDKSLVLVKMRGGEGRYSMLETVRAYAAEELERHGEVGTLEARHASYYLGLAEEIGPKIRLAASSGYISQIEAEKDNLMLALDWATKHSAQFGLRLIVALGWYWHLSTLFTEGVDWLKKILPTARVSYSEDLSEDDKHVLGYALYIGAKMGRWSGEVADAWQWIQESVALLRPLGEAAELVDAMTMYAALGYLQGKYDREAEVAIFEDTLAMARRLGDQWGECQLLTGLAWRAMWRGDFTEAEGYFNANLKLAREIDHRQSVAGALMNLGDLARLNGDWARARSLYIQGLTLARQERVGWATALGLANLGRVLLEGGDTSGARKLLAESLGVVGQRQALQDKLWTLVLIVWALLEDGKIGPACRLMGAVSVLREKAGTDAVVTRVADMERVVERVDGFLQEIANAILWEEGRSLDVVETLDFAVDAALGRA